MIKKGISFNDIHSYRDLNLILSGESIPPAQPKTNYVELVGGNGTLDLTEAHGEVKFKDRDGCKFTFTMHPSGDLSEEGFVRKKMEVSNALNGKYFERITLDKDYGYYYQGRVSVDEYQSDKRIRQIVVTGKLKPYKYKQEETVHEFNLTEEPQTVVIENDRMTVIPEITCTDDNTKIIFGELEVVLNAGTHEVLGIQFTEGENELILSGNGTITFKFQEGAL